MPARRVPRGRGGGAPGRRPGHSGRTESARDRFLRTDRYRAEREWGRYEGTAQRRLWRELRERFLARNTPDHRIALDEGAGPGRFTRWLGPPGTRRVALDVSRRMLEVLANHWGENAPGEPVPDRVVGDAARPPFSPAAFGRVFVLGNTLGFAGAQSERVWNASLGLVAPGGTLCAEIAPGPGERSRYLGRLPESVLPRLLRVPVAALVPRVEREGFAPLEARRPPSSEFRRLDPSEIRLRIEREGWSVLEMMAVAPALGAEPSRVERIQGDPRAWDHLLILEEFLGRQPGRQTVAAAVLVAAARPLGNRDR